MSPLASWLVMGAAMGAVWLIMLALYLLSRRGPRHDPSVPICNRYYDKDRH